MPTTHRDSQGFYRVLMLNVEASEEQVQLAYEMLSEMAPEQAGATRSEIERAYSVLKNPASRATYDRLETMPVRPPRKWSLKMIKLNDPRLLAACVVLLVAILGLVWVPLYGSRFRSFSAGDQLVDLNGHAFGTIVQSDERHTFPGGQSSEAFLVEISSTKELRWFPAMDLKAACRKRR